MLLLFQIGPSCKRLSRAKKLVLESATSLSATETSKEDDVPLQRKSCVYFSIWFKKKEVQTLIDLASEINTMTPAYASKLDLHVHQTNVGVQQIDGSTLQIFGMGLANFQVEDKLGRARFIQETFLLADISTEMVLGLLFLTLSNVKDQFVEKELIWRSYTTAKALLTTKRVELIDKKEFANAALDENSETFVVPVASLNLGIHSDKEAQRASLLTKEFKILDKYLDFADVFSKEKALVLSERTELNEHAIKLEDDKQPPYRPIYSLYPVELETLKTYIETHLKTGFIWPSKFLAGVLILFDKKPDNSLCLWVDYWGFNNLTIKNQYPLALLGESLVRLGQAKRFTQLDVTSIQHQRRIKEGDNWKTAFQTKYGHFEYQVMPFGLFNAPASFQGYINKILAEKLNIFVIVYLDDILIYTKDQGQGHVKAVRWVLDLLRKNGLFTNLKKCRFHKDEVRFLRYVVSSQSIRIEDERIKAVRNWPEPKSV